MSQANKKPPRIAEWLLSRTLGKHDRDIVLGDFEEFYIEFLNESGAVSASTWYWMQTIKSIPAFISNSIYWNAVMFKNYFKIALRNMQRQKLFSFINISGLAIGITCCLLVLLFIQNELSYDMFHVNADRIYRLEEGYTFNDEFRRTEYTAAPYGPTMVKEFPEVVNSVRIDNGYIWDRIFIRYKEKEFFEEYFNVADPSIFEVFSFPLIKGDPTTALNDPKAIVITEKIAKKYLGNEDPLGKTLSVTLYRTGSGSNHDLTVTGVMKNIPPNSHLQFDILGSINGFETFYDFGEWMDRWYGDFFTNFLLLREQSFFKDLENKFPNFIKKYKTDDTQDTKLFLKPLKEVYFTPEIKRYIYIITAVSLFILLIACFNFINLSTARSLSRAKEIGVRKVIGANRAGLIKQFIGESVLFSIFSLVIALALIKLLLPVFNTFVDRNLQFDYFQNPFIIFTSVILALIVGILAGAYPAFFLSRFRPVTMVHGISETSSKRFRLRNILVVFQFAVTVVFFIGGIITFNQVSYISNTNLGFDKEQVINVTMHESFTRERLESIKNELLGNANISHATYSTSIPFTETRKRTVETQNGEHIGFLYFIYTDYDFIETMGINLIEGRNFSQAYSSDVSETIIINETAAKKYTHDSPIGSKIMLSSISKYNIIGIVKDFHIHSLHREIVPLAITVMPSVFRDYKYISVKIHPGKIPEVINFLQNTMKKFSPGYPFEYTFFDERINALYKNEHRLITVFSSISILAIFIACLGLFGLAAFSAERRTKEIGIRRALGATVPGIVMLLSKDFAKLVLAANVIAWPIAYLIMDRWLQNFAYRINFGWWVFILAGILTLAISIITISYQSIKSATANPIDSLRYE